MEPTSFIIGNVNSNMPNSKRSLSTEKSPWHESDSGLSVTSETGSSAELNRSPVSELDLGKDFHLGEWPEAEDDLAAYLLGDGVQLLNADSDHENLPLESDAATYKNPLYVMNQQGTYNTRSSTNSLPSGKRLPLQDDYVNVEHSDSESSNGGVSPAQSNGSHSSNPLNYFHDIVNTAKPKPNVKIVKVLKAPANSDCLDDDIVKALDERSKKNAIQAKLNREKKKKYVNSLEGDVERLKGENSSLKEENAELNKEVGSLEEEVRYLKSVLVNASALSGMLRNINGVSGVNLSSSIVGSRKRAAVSTSSSDDHSYTATSSSADAESRAERSGKRARFVRENLEKAGVCLHVNGSEASLEFCHNCSSLAKGALSRRWKS